MAHGPFELVLGPAGYGLPLVPGEQVGERELALMLLLRDDEPHGRIGVGGMRSIIRALIAAGLPLVFGPGAIHLPTIPAHRKWNRIDLGTADKVASAALCIADQARRLGVAYEETSFVMLELGGAFSAALAVDGGQHRRRARRLGQADRGARVRCAGRGGRLPARRRAVEGDGVQRRGARPRAPISPRGARAVRATRLPRGLARARGGRREGRARADRRVPAPREILVAGRLAAPGVLDALGERLARVAPVRIAAGRRPPRRARRCWPTAWPAAATRALVERLGMRDASGSALDHLRIHGADRIRLR